MVTINSNDSIIEIGNIENSSFKTLINSYQFVIVLVDENTKILLPKITVLLAEHQLKIIEIVSGEKQKNLSTCQFIWQQLIDFAVDRKSLFINLGGGVITDMGAFAASTFKRGIDFVNIPTSLLSMVDASVGGKTGINFEGYKNNIGLFITPKAVYCDVSFLVTLPLRERIAGIGEILKHALITDSIYWNYLKEHNFVSWNWENVIKQSITIKNALVIKDPLEKHERKKLNFGHTIGHAIESDCLAQNRDLLHGEAVAVGMICESYISYKTTNLSKDELDEIVGLIETIFKLPVITADDSKLLGLMLQDKKNENNKINFTLLNRIGSSTINNYVSEDLIKESLVFYRNRVQ